MEQKIVRPRAGLQLRKVGNRYMIVVANDTDVNVSDVYSLNHTAACLWERMGQKGCTAGELVDFVCEKFDTDRQTALCDVERQLEEWGNFGLIIA